jgi:hypothetical protein
MIWRRLLGAVLVLCALALAQVAYLAALVGFAKSDFVTRDGNLLIVMFAFGLGAIAIGIAFVGFRLFFRTERPRTNQPPD